MTVAKLIEQLKELPLDVPVVIYSMDTFVAFNPTKVYFTEKMQMVTVEVRA